MNVTLELRELYARVLAVLSPVLGPRIRALCYRSLLKTFNKKSRNVTSVFGVTLESNWQDATFLMAASGSWGFYLHDFLRERKKPYAFIDIGANFGLYTSIAAQSCNCKMAVAIEPNPSIFQLLKKNVASNLTGGGRTKFYNCAIDRVNGIKKLAFNSNNLGKANLLGQGDESVDCECKNFLLLNEINRFVKNFSVIVKIDVEGLEGQVIQEISQSELKDNIDYIFMEISPSWMSEEEFQRMLSHLNEMGFEKCWQGFGKAQYDALFKKENVTR